MNPLTAPWCFLRMLWRSFWCGAWVSGHNFQTDIEPTPPNVHVLECTTCDARSIAWSWESMEHLK